MKLQGRQYRPFLKWAGGKRWLTYNYPELFPKNFNTYFEPFLGSAAVYFYLLPRHAVLSDINDDLINAYHAIKFEYKDVEKELYYHQVMHSKDYYYYMRSRKLRASRKRAAQFIYLNRTCWNGLYRVNREGRFNVPVGTKTSVILPTDNFKGISKLLSGANIEHSDFADTINQAGENDFLFIDPPYTVKHNDNNFRKYNEKIFSWEDQIRLRDCVISAAGRGVKIMVCNANNYSIKELYKNVGDINFACRYSCLCPDSEKRHLTSELVISCNIN